jgi:hypothetical protein
MYYKYKKQIKDNQIKYILSSKNKFGSYVTYFFNDFFHTEIPAIKQQNLFAATLTNNGFSV